jgi:hypothetical protein
MDEPELVELLSAQKDSFLTNFLKDLNLLV